MRFEDAVMSLEAHIKAEGTAAVARSFVTANGHRLGVWVHNMRSRYHRGQLTPEQVDTLDRVGFVWQVLDRDRERGNAIAALRAYRAAQGSLPPADHMTADGFALGSWLQALKRRARKRPGDEQATAARILVELGIPVWEREHDALWEEGLHALRVYVETHGDTRVPFRWAGPNGFPLGRWVNSRRADAAAGRLRPERRGELDEIDFEYVLAPSTYSPARKAQEDAHFQKRIAELIDFSASQGHLRVPARHITDQGTHLGRWVLRQRRERAAHRLAAERITQLDAIGFLWSVERATTVTPSPM